MGVGGELDKSVSVVLRSCTVVCFHVTLLVFSLFSCLFLVQLPVIIVIAIAKDVTH